MTHYLPKSTWDKMSVQDRKEFLIRLKMDVQAIVFDPQSGLDLVELAPRSTWYDTQPSYKVLSGEFS